MEDDTLVESSFSATITAAIQRRASTDAREAVHRIQAGEAVPTSARVLEVNPSDLYRWYIASPSSWANVLLLAQGRSRWSRTNQPNWSARQRIAVAYESPRQSVRGNRA